jgi:hypothetical protein
MSEDSIPKEYEGGEKLLVGNHPHPILEYMPNNFKVTIAEKDQNKQDIPEETQQKQLKEYVI